jgi:hypothetical protein
LAAYGNLNLHKLLNYPIDACRRPLLPSSPSFENNTQTPPAISLLMNSHRLLKIVGLAVALSPLSVLGATSGPFTQTVALPASGGGPGVVTLPLFNPALGTLTGVTLTTSTSLNNVEYQFDSDYNGNNTAFGSISNNTSNFSTAVSIAGTGITAAGLLVTGSSNQVLGPTTGDSTTQFDAQPGHVDYWDWQPGLLSSGTVGGAVTGSLVSYIGPGNFTLSLDSFFSATSHFVGGDGYASYNTADGLFTGTVTYTYTIPEPSTYALILGLLTLGVVGVRRFKKSQ